MRSARETFTDGRTVYDVSPLAHTTNPIWAAARLRTSDVRISTDTANAPSMSMTNHVIVERATVLRKTAVDAVRDTIDEIFLPVIPHEQRRDAPGYVVATS
jgi:hypothetical protein